MSVSGMVKVYTDVSSGEIEEHYNFLGAYHVPGTLHILFQSLVCLEQWGVMWRNCIL